MKLSELYLQSRTAAQETSNQKKASANSGFDQLLSTADKASNAKTAVDVGKSSNQYDDNAAKTNEPKTKNKTNENAKLLNSQNKPVSNAADTKQEVAQTTQSSTPTTVKPVETEVEASVQIELTKTESEMVQAIADELGISNEAVMQILAQLNISPLELVQPENLVQFMQVLHGVETSVELLTVDTVQETMKTLQVITEDFQDDAVKFAEAIELRKLEIATPESTVTVETEVKMQTEQIPENVEVLIAATAQKTTDTSTSISNDADVLKPDFAPQQTQVENAPKDLEVTQVVADVEVEEGLIQSSEQNIGEKVQTAQPLQTTTTAPTIVEKPEIFIPNVDKMQQVDGIVANPANQSVSEMAEVTANRTESVKNLNTQDVINQIVEKMKVEIKADNTSEIKIALRPEHLGDVTLKITTQNGIVTAQFVAESQRVKEIIEAGFSQLKDSLQEQGIVLSELSVSVGQNDSERRMAQFQEGRAKSARRINQILDSVEGINASDLDEATARAINEGDVYETNLDYSV